MADKISGWDTEGVTNLGALTDGKLKLEFTGKDGQKRNIFMPTDAIPNLVASLVAFNALVAKAQGTPDTLSGKHMLGITRIAIASDEKGAEFAMALTTGDGLELRCLLPVDVAEALATGLVATLLKHGITLPLLTSGGSRH